MKRKLINEDVDIQEKKEVERAIKCTKKLSLIEQKIYRRIAHLYGGFTDKIFAPNKLGKYTPPPNELENIYNEKIKGKIVK
jgi:hypothetical protein